MSRAANPPSADDPRLLRAVQDYLADLEAGRRPDRRDLAARYPDLASALTPYLDALDMVHGAVQTVIPPEPLAPPAEPLGDFRIVREIGRGGMGVVYEAVQMSLGRRVALKVLPFAATLDARQLQRFRNEAQAAAQLHHTNIVPVYAVDCQRGLHFYAMQLIEGRTLDAVIRELRVEAGRPSPDSSATTVDLRDAPTRPVQPSTAQRTQRGRESYRTAARIAAQVADALEYAHNAGVVHRDVKPANLLLDARGNVWITDFGLAQVSADVSLTRTGDLLGTLRYMSPEQAAGRHVQVDHRSDVYSLGATLYELLTLEPAFPGHDRQTLLQQILNDEPRPPRQIDRAIPVELETIVLKSLAKAPGDRYASAGEMAADLRRFLDERPILARRPTLLERARKWMRRHPAVVGAALLLLIFSVIILSASTVVVAHQRSRERKRAQEAEERFELARQSADDMIQIAEEELADNPFMEGTYKRMLESALTHYEKFIEQRRDDPDAQAQLEVTRNRVKKIIDDLAVLQGDRQIPLLRDPAVLDDLKVSGEQRQRLAEMMQKLDEKRDDPFRGFHKLTAEERRQRFLEVGQANRVAVAAILDARQLRRLREIALQMQGARAFRESEVATALRLTVEQRARIRAIEEESYLGGPRERPSFDSDEFRKAIEKRVQAALERTLAVLTPEQARRWHDMTGEPFKGPLRGFFIGPRLFGPPPGAGPGPLAPRP